MSVSVAQLTIDIRDILGDFDGTRYTPERILRVINKAVKQFSLDTEILSGFTDAVEPTECPYTFKLHDEAITLTRVTLGGVNIKVVSHEDMDLIDQRWQTRTTMSKVTHVIYDKMDKGKVRLYPTPTDIALHYFNKNTAYGILTVPTNKEYGLYHDTSKLDSSRCNKMTDQQYGILEGLSLFKIDLDFYYTRTHKELKSQSDLLGFDDVWANAILHYASSRLLLSDRDVQNNTLASIEYKNYMKEVAKAKAHKARSFTRANQYLINYRRF